MMSAMLIRCSPLLVDAVGKAAAKEGFGHRNRGSWLLRKLAELTGLSYQQARDGAPSVDHRQLSLPTPPPRPKGGERQDRRRKSRAQREAAASSKAPRHSRSWLKRQAARKRRGTK